MANVLLLPGIWTNPSQPGRRSHQFSKWPLHRPLLWEEEVDLRSPFHRTTEDRGSVSREQCLEERCASVPWSNTRRHRHSMTSSNHNSQQETHAQFPPGEDVIGKRFL